MLLYQHTQSDGCRHGRCWTKGCQRVLCQLHPWPGRSRLQDTRLYASWLSYAYTSARHRHGKRQRHVNQCVRQRDRASVRERRAQCVGDWGNSPSGENVQNEEAQCLSGHPRLAAVHSANNTHITTRPQNVVSCFTHQPPSRPLTVNAAHKGLEWHFQQGTR